jgi:hypothetical protein
MALSVFMVPNRFAELKHSTQSEGMAFDHDTELVLLPGLCTESHS